jgi:hypothetical protein
MRQVLLCSYMCPQRVASQWFGVIDSAASKLQFVQAAVLMAPTVPGHVLCRCTLHQVGFRCVLELLLADMGRCASQHGTCAVCRGLHVLLWPCLVVRLRTICRPQPCSSLHTSQGLCTLLVSSQAPSSSAVYVTSLDRVGVQPALNPCYGSPFSAF